MNEMSTIAEQSIVADQHMATALILLFGILATVLARWLFRRRYPHLFAWLAFLGWSAAVSFVPVLRQMDLEQPWFYALRGIPLGLLLASMLSFAEVSRRRPFRSREEAAAETPLLPDAGS